MAGFEDLDRFGILNILPSLVQSLGFNRDEIFKLSVVEVYLEIQRISIVNKCTSNLQKILANKK